MLSKQRSLAWLIVLSCTAAGCSSSTEEVDIGPVRVVNRLGPMTVAVAPALNLSGTTNFDRNKVADLMAGELAYADGINVIPVSRVLAVLDRQGSAGVESPAHALEIAGVLGADAILVFAVTEYDPYNPPVVGIAAQLYGQVPGGRPLGGSERGSQVDPVLVQRQAFEPVDRQGPGARIEPISQTQRVFNAAHERIERSVKDYASSRSAGENPYGWRLYLVSQQHFLRYCCWNVIESLMAGSHIDSLLLAKGAEVDAR